MGVARVIVEAAQHIAGGKLGLEEARASALGHDGKRARSVAGARDHVNGAAHGGSAEPQRVGALVHLDGIRGEQFDGLEIGKAIGVAVWHAINQQVDAARVKVVAKAGPADRNLAFIRRAEPGLDVHTRRELQRVLEIGSARLVNFPCGHQRHAARHFSEACLALRLVARGTDHRDISELHRRWLEAEVECQLISGKETDLGAGAVVARPPHYDGAKAGGNAGKPVASQ